MNFKTDLSPPADSFENLRQPDHAMNKQESENVTDRELFSELFETLINPLLIHMVPPFILSSHSGRLYVTADADIYCAHKPLKLKGNSDCSNSLHASFKRFIASD